MNDGSRGSNVNGHRARADQQPLQHPGDTSAGFIPLSSIRAPSSRLDMGAIRERLAGARGQQYWRSLEELAETEEFQRYLEREFPNQAPRDMSPLSRREFFRVMGATLALAGVAGCSYQPPERIVPYVEQPEELIPGKPLYYTTAFPRGGYAYGVLAESQMGRPVKLEGNPDHPASKGATDTFTQASILGLYDPDRSQAVRQLGDLTTWDVFLGAITDQLDALRRTKGAGLRLVTETITSPTLASQVRQFLAIYPQARVCQHEPAGRDSVRDGARLAFGDEVNPVYHFDRAERVLSLDSNFLVEEPGSVRYARDIVGARLVRGGGTKMNRLYVAESSPTITGAYADHRMPLRPGLIEPLARAVAAGLGVAGVAAGTPPAGVPPEWVAAVVKDLQSFRGASLVVAGVHQSPAVHALAHAMNQTLGNVGKTVSYTAPVEVHFGAREGTLRELVDDMRGGRVQTLVIMGANPAYSAPADLEFAAAMQEKGPEGRDKVPLRIHLGLYDDETGVLCHWHVPESHYLETWGDVRAYDGTVSLIQPLIIPLYSTHSAQEFLAVLLGEGDRYGYDILREYWMGQNKSYTTTAAIGASESASGAGAAPGGAGLQPVAPTPAFEQFWRKALVAGMIAGTQAPPRNVTLRSGFAGTGSTPAGNGLEIAFRPDPTIWDGRFANNPWLQELPKPLTKLVWDNAALVSPKTAQDQRLNSGDIVELKIQGRTLRTPVWIAPGQPDGAVTLYLGYGRTRAGNVGNGTGFNAYALRSQDAPWFVSGVEMQKTGGHYKLVSAQHHFSVEGRPLIREGSLEDLSKNPRKPEFMQPEEEGPQQSLYPNMWPSDRKPSGTGEATGGGDPGAYPHQGYNDLPVPAWGMVIDTTACIGCNACVVACQSENNIATVGKDEVANMRQMHWIRIDTYYRGSPDNPDTVFEPIPCMHCEEAPCEPVCPVEATTHSAEGINEQTYNRCVGTRYCQNNCPYKVRRFNYFQYSDQQTPVIQMRQNPDVTVRSRGVMEKCTYCVQRINEARIQAEKEDRAIRDGDIVTACAQVCPTNAIVFGNINDRVSHGGKGSLVRQLKTDPLKFDLLAELNTRPRTSYLAKLRNLNPELPKA